MTDPQSETTTSRNRELAEVFRAAADGAMAPFMRGGPFSAASYDSAMITSGTLRAISTVYANLADIDEKREVGTHA